MKYIGQWCLQNYITYFINDPRGKTQRKSYQSRNVIHTSSEFKEKCPFNRDTKVSGLYSVIPPAGDPKCPPSDRQWRYSNRFTIEIQWCFLWHCIYPGKMNQRSDTLRELTHRSTFQNDRPRELRYLIVENHGRSSLSKKNEELN